MVSQAVQTTPSPLTQNIQANPSSTRRDIAIQCNLLYEEQQGDVIASPPQPDGAGDQSQIAAPSPAAQTDVQLSPEQKQVLELVLQGANVFFTGPAGTGKSVLLRQLITQLRAVFDEPAAVAVTAPTGIAGLNIHGSTIHSWAGIGLGKEKADKLAARISGSFIQREKWTKCQVLIIDEISMLDGNLFDKLEFIGRYVRKNNRPFGGIQLVLSGDFFQLPPVPEQSHKYQMSSTFAFDSLTWSVCIKHTIALTRVFRQKSSEFIDILSAMRTGILEHAHIRRLQSLNREVHYPDGIEPTELFPLRAQVDRCNRERLAALPGAAQTYRAIDTVGYDVSGVPIPPDSAKMLLDRLVALPTVSLKIGAQVMLIANVVQKSLVNGSVGRVVDFITVREAIQRAIKVAEIAREQTGPADGPMVPLSHRELDAQDEQIFSHKQRWPLVEFSGALLLCAPLEWDVQGVIGNKEVCRMQVPLILAWAISIHKSQGQTMERVKVDLDRIFEKGQAYVALSRATSMEGLQITNFQPGKIMPHPRVIAWQGNWSPPAKEAPQDSNWEEMDSQEAVEQYWNTVPV